MGDVKVKSLCGGWKCDYCMCDHLSGWDGGEVLVGSSSGFQIDENCKPQSRFMDCLLLLCMASIVLLFQCLMAVAWTLHHPSGLSNVCEMACSHSRALHGQHSSSSLLRYSVLLASACSSIFPGSKDGLHASQCTYLLLTQSSDIR